MLTSEELGLIISLLGHHEAYLKPVTDHVLRDRFLRNCVNESSLMAAFRDKHVYELVQHSETPDAGLMIVRVSFPALSGKRTIYVSELQLLGWKQLHQHYGHLLIRPETLRDKVNELFRRVEIDFETHPVFSSEYYYSAQDEQQAISFATQERLTLLERQNKLLLEVNGDLLLARYPRKLNATDFSTLLDFVREI